MLGKLKSALGDSAVKTAAQKLEPVLVEKLAALDIKPTDIADDEKYHTYVVTPTLLALKASSGGLTGLLADFDSRFGKAMMHLRDELLVVDADNAKVSLAPDYKSRLTTVLVEGLSKAG